MRILVTSDIHGDKEALNRLLSKENYDIHLDAGDSNYSHEELARRQIISVKGNTDFFANLPLIRVIENELGKILIVHGHQYSVKYGLSYLYQLGESQRANYVIYGHTHLQKHEVINGITYLNPGSLKYRWQYAIITKDEVILKEL